MHVASALSQGPADNLLLLGFLLYGQRSRGSTSRLRPRRSWSRSPRQARHLSGQKCYGMSVFPSCLCTCLPRGDGYNVGKFQTDRLRSYPYKLFPRGACFTARPGVTSVSQCHFRPPQLASEWLSPQPGKRP